MMRILQLALALTVLGWLLAGQVAHRLPAPREILPPLWNVPQQVATDRPAFALEHKGARYEVQPVAEYEVYGLVVTHNDTHGFMDPYHDKNSFDTKDLCVLWGDSLRHENFQRVKFYSTPFWCHFEWRAGGEIDPSDVGNNHMVTDRPELRRTLDSVNIGDQIHFHGWLVNYCDLRNPGQWRRSSTVRTDSGDGACEVVFFDRLEVLGRHAPRAYLLRKVLVWLALALLLGILALAAITDPKLGGS